MRIQKLALASIFIVFLIACNGGGSCTDCNAQPIPPVEGTINSPKIDLNTLQLTKLDPQVTPSLFAALKDLSVEEINKIAISQLESQGISQQNLEPPIRGMNALVLSKVIAVANGQGSLFSNQNNKVLAVDSQGNVIAKTDVDPTNGSFRLELQEEDIKDQDLALVFAEEVNGKLICKQPLEIDPTNLNEIEGENDNQLLVVDSNSLEQAKLSTQQDNNKVVDLGDLGFNPETGNPDNVEAATITPIDNNAFEADTDGDNVPNFVENCGDDNVNPHLLANFTWQMPPNEDEKFLYDYGLSIALDKDQGIKQEDLTAAGAAGMDGNGVMDMSIMKLAPAEKLAIAIMDEAYIVDNRAPFPLTPFFDINAALDSQEPFKTVQNQNIEQDFSFNQDSELIKGMALITGTVTDSSGDPIAGATVIGSLNSEIVLDFSIGLTDSNGKYELFLPALNAQVFPKYTIIGANSNGTLLARRDEFIDESKEFTVDLILK